MSFGWSAGDIVAALKLLHQIGSALRDSGGASSDFQDTLSFLQTLSRTLEHLNVLQATGLDPDVADNVREQCDHIRVPLADFLKDVGRRFEPSLGVKSERNKILVASRKIQWALSASKKTKRLQDRIAVPMASVGLVLGQQILLTTLKMPQDILDRISHTIDTSIKTRIVPETTLVNRKIEALLQAQISSVDIITRSVQEVGRCTAETMHRKTIEDREANAKLESHLERLLKSKETSSETNIPNPQLATTDVVKSSQRASLENSNLLGRHPFGDRIQPSSLRKKLDLVDSSISAIESSLKGLSTASGKLGVDHSKSDVERAIQNILHCIWLLLSSLQLLIRELVKLLSPYLIAFYRTSIQGLLQYGDHFLFEDGIGRLKRLPCAQFQHWNVFYDFLVNSFQGAPGLSLVLTQQFRVMNGYNDYPITLDAWRAVIQPKAKVTMAMVVFNSDVVRQGSCADPSCSGEVSFTVAKLTCICPVCGKYIYTLTEKMSIMTPSRDKAILKEGQEPQPGFEESKSKSQTSSNTPDNEIAAFKRVISSVLRVRERPINRRRREGKSPRFNEYFVPKDGIDREVITADITRYLGNDALVRPGIYEVYSPSYPEYWKHIDTIFKDPQTKQRQQGYFITAHRNLTPAMIADLKTDSERWEAERRATEYRAKPLQGPPERVLGHDFGGYSTTH